MHVIDVILQPVKKSPLWKVCVARTYLIYLRRILFTKVIKIEVIQ